MKIIDWLLTQDPVIVRLTNKYLNDMNVPYHEDGYIKTYLSLYDTQKNMWGQGIYSPKWISTHYTLFELLYMEINPNHPIYQRALFHILKVMWQKDGYVSKYRHQDLCVVAMMLNMLAYMDINHPIVEEMLDYILKHTFSDGGWNCSWESKKPKQSSLHTTCSVLEAFSMLKQKGYQKRDLSTYIESGVRFILKKKFFRRETNHEIIHQEMANYHYPYRWKYDYLRALECMISFNYPYHSHMDESLSLLRQDIKKGYLKPGYRYPGKTHITLEKKMSGFNTLRALKVLKYYDQPFYNHITNQDFEY